MAGVGNEEGLGVRRFFARYRRPIIVLGSGWNRNRMMGLGMTASCGPCNACFTTNYSWSEAIVWIRRHEAHYPYVNYPPVEEGEELEP